MQSNKVEKQEIKMLQCEKFLTNQNVKTVKRTPSSDKIENYYIRLRAALSIQTLSTAGKLTSL